MPTDSACEKCHIRIGYELSDIAFPMQVAQGVSYAFHALVQIARARPEQTVTVEEMASALGASPSYMAKLFQRLARAGLVTSYRGRNGGYSLGRPAREITLWETAAALQENLIPEAPLLPACSTCPLASACPMRVAMETAAAKVEQVMRTVNVAGMARLAERAGLNGDVGAGTRLERCIGDSPSRKKARR